MIELWLNKRLSKFSRDVGVLISGTAFSQVLMMGALPLLTRLYTPEDFAVYAIYVAILGVLSSVACLRLDIAIPLPEEDSEASRLFLLSLIANLVVTLVVVVAVVLPLDFGETLGVPKLDPYIWLLPIAVLGTGFYTAIQYWCVRQKRFREIAKSRIQRTFVSVSVQLGFGIYTVGPLGLIIGQIIIQAGGVLGLGRYALKSIKQESRQLKYSYLKETLHRYRRFPLYSTIEALCNSAAMQLPIILISGLVGGAEVGFLMLGMRVMAAPMSLLGSSVAQVYMSQAAEKDREGLLSEFTLAIVGRLLLTGGTLIVIGGGLSPFLFPYIFGPEWQRAGELVLWMTPWFVIQFSTSPVSMALHVKNKQKLALWLQVLGLVLRAGAVLLASLYLTTYVAEIYTISGLVFYAIYFVLVFKVVGGRTAQLRRLVIPFLALMSLLSLFVLALFNLNI